MNKFIILFMLLTFTLMPVYAVITDDFAETTLDRNLQIKEYTPKLITDDFAESGGKHSEKRGKYVISEEINSSTLKLQSKEQITTKTKPEEGSEVHFVLAENFKYNEKTYPAGTDVKARIETVSMNANWGVPAEIIIGNFLMDDMPLAGEITKTGKNKTLWVKPLAYAGTVLFGAGIFFMFIKGGHAKIKQGEILEL